MADLALIWDSNTLTADMAVELNDFVRDDGLKTAVELSLFTDRQAEDGEQLPTTDTDRRGWWADDTPVVEGDKIGSRLWLLVREKQTPTFLPRLERTAREALQWLVMDKVAERIEVIASFPRPGMWGLVVEIFRPRADPVRFRFDGAWNDSALRQSSEPTELGIVTTGGEYASTVGGNYLITD